MSKCDIHCRIQCFAQRRKNTLAHAIASDRQVSIGKVFTPGLSQFAQVSAELAASNSQKRTHDTALTKLMFREDARHASRACSSDNLHQHRLSLIVERVCRSDPIDCVCQQ